MSDLSQHGEWLSLIDVSGPFLAEPVLKQVFPQGLEQIDPLNRKAVRQAYEEWREAIDLDDPQLPAFHKAWVELVLKRVLELDEDDEEDILKPRAKLSDALTHLIPEHGVTLRPDFAVVDDQNNGRPLMLIQVFSHDVNLDESIKGDRWATSPAERMVALCRAHDVRLGLLTNGEQWMLIDAPVGAVTTFASWYARLWGQEPITLQAFVNLLGIRRFFVDPSEQLPALFDESLKLQDEVTDALGEQVRRAVEVLIQRLDRADVDLNRELLVGVEPSELYEAALTVMMRIVFLLSAEERGLLLMGDERYEENYAISTLRMQLRAESEEILERRQDAWSRLLSIFRAVFGGIQHETMRLPALGGSLFDPDRFPFLEGRSKGSNWKNDPAKPLPIDNRTVLLLLDAVQLFQGRTLSYRALDVEQIGYVYEGLLERTVVRAKEVTLDLDAAKKSKKPWVTLNELEAAAGERDNALAVLLEERSGSSASRVKNDLAKKVDEAAADKLLTACHGDQALRARIKPYFHFLQMDRWGYPLVYPEKTFMVTTGADRRETGTHYTPKSFTEVIIKETLEPIVYVGPVEGRPREEWALKTPAELLDLKICDPAMGSGAFLVQACRWLSERLVEAWNNAEKQGSAVTSEGVVVDKLNEYEPLRNDAEERLLTAKRLIAERCLYGVDVNPLAVELAKLSIWLVTLAKGRPFGFLDHNLRSGDSLLGISNLEQLHYLDMNPDKGSLKRLFARKIDQAVEEAIRLRAELRARPIRDIRDVEIMESLDEQAKEKLHLPELIADALVGEVLAAGGKGVDTTALSIEAGGALERDRSKAHSLKGRADKGLTTDLPTGKPARRPFHWPLEFPEVFSRKRTGFDVAVGNPPFMGGRKIANAFSKNYHDYIALIREWVKGSPDLCAYFILRSFKLCNSSGAIGMIATNSVSQTGSRKVCLDRILAAGGSIKFAVSKQQWPGAASVSVSMLAIVKSSWNGKNVLDGKTAASIDGGFGESLDISEPKKLKSMKGRFSQGQDLMGRGFELTKDEKDELIERDPKSEEVIFPLFNGRDINNLPTLSPHRWAINFGQMEENEARLYPAAFERLEELVKPYRDALTGQIHERCFWKYWDYRKKLVEQYETHDFILASPVVTKYVNFRMVPTGNIYNHKVKLYYFYSWREFSILQSTIHQEWAHWRCATLGGSTFSYSTSAALETWPMLEAPNTENTQELEECGRNYHELRNQIMMENDEGLTGVYNKLHDPEMVNDEITTLRVMHRKMDHLVLEEYGWSDINLEYDYREFGNAIRFTISKENKAELIKRLVNLNGEIEKEENAKSVKKVSTGAGVGSKQVGSRLLENLQLDFGDEDSEIANSLDSETSEGNILPSSGRRE